MLQARAGGFVMIGNGSAKDGVVHHVHTPGYDLNDDILTLGVAYWVQLVRIELGKRAPVRSRLRPSPAPGPWRRTPRPPSARRRPRPGAAGAPLAVSPARRETALADFDQGVMRPLAGRPLVILPRLHE